jgi:hypothetical protein
VTHRDACPEADPIEAIGYDRVAAPELRVVSVVAPRQDNLVRRLDLEELPLAGNMLPSARCRSSY